MPFIYKTTNTITGMIYIGKTKFTNPDYFGSGIKITNAIKKYGKENFNKVIIEECLDSEVNDREMFWIKACNATDATVGYNLSKGGDGGAHYWDTLTEEQRKEHNKKISSSKKGKPHAPHSDETKKKMSASFNRDPEFIRTRAKKKCKEFTCVDHANKKMYFTTDLKHFCQEQLLTYANMLYNANTKKNFTEGHWSCRKGILDGDIISDLEAAVQDSMNMIKQKVGKHERTGNKNPMFGKKHTADTKNKIRESKLNK